MRYYANEPKGAIDKVETHVESAALEKLLAQHAPADQYRVATNEDKDHEWGSGGFRERTTQLLKGDQPLILSVYYDSWETTSDDSTDYASMKVRRTYLLRDDPVAKLIFDMLRACAQPAQV